MHCPYGITLIFYEYRLYLLLMLPYCSVRDIACLSDIFIRQMGLCLLVRLLFNPRGTAVQGTGQDMTCQAFIEDKSRISNINTHLLVCSFLNLEITLPDYLSASDIKRENCVAKVPVKRDEYYNMHLLSSAYV